MNTAEERIAELEEKVKKLEKITAYQKAAEVKVVEIARQYGMMKTFRRTFDPVSETTTSYCHDDADRRIAFLKEQLLIAAIDLILEDTLVGMPR